MYSYKVTAFPPSNNRIFSGLSNMAYGTPSVSRSSTIICLVVLAFTSCVNFYVIFRSQTGARRTPKDDREENVELVYEDEDGVATNESQKLQRTSISKWLASLTAGLGVLMSLSLAVYRYYAIPGFKIEFVNDWLSLANWVSIPACCVFLTDLFARSHSLY